MATRVIDPGTDVVRLEVSDRFGIITLNRPERRNALHHEMYAPIKRVLTEFADDDDVSCIVVTGAGVGFCAGGDVRGDRPRDRSQAPPSVDEAAADLLDRAQLSRLLHESPKLTIAAVNGAAVGAGLSIALACDLRIIAPSATLITGWARLAFSGDFGGAWFLTRLVGPAKALELLVGNATVGAQEALRLGLVNHVADIDGADPDAFGPAWRAWAAPFAAASREATAMMKANVRQALVDPLSTALVDESRRMVEAGRTADHKHAVRAWLDKRDPDFGAGRPEPS